MCADERQWVPPGGQRWTTLAELAAAGHRSDIRAVEPGLTGIGADPPVAIGQRSLLVSTPEGNLLWDPSGFIDDAAVAAVRSAGGLRFVTASHPHFYGSIASWARSFGAEILVPADDVAWLRADAELPVRLWSGVLEVLPGVTLVQCGGHFPGSAVLHWAAGASGRGVLLSRRHDLRDAGRGPGDVRLLGAEPAAAVRGGGSGRGLGGGAVPVRPDLRRLVDPGAAVGGVGDGAAFGVAVHRAPGGRGLGLGEQQMPTDLAASGFGLA